MFTGQRLDRSTGGLMDYGARCYLPGLGRFISADTIVPSLINPQALNRYLYGLGNPIKFIDPTGHTTECKEGDTSVECQIDSYNQKLLKYGVDVKFDWGNGEIKLDQQLASLKEILKGVEAYASKMGGADFANMIRHTEFTVCKGDCVADDDNDPNTDTRWGVNQEPIRDENGNITTFKIRLELEHLLGSSTKNEGEALVAHELGHNLTRLGITPDVSAINKYLGVNTGVNTSKNPYEDDADAFASWALGRFDILPGTKIPNTNILLTTDYLSSQIRCWVAPSSRACGG
jgi:RHS repeat-associated protein